MYNKTYNIVDGKTETVIEFENEEIVIFKDIKPASDYHFLAVSKVHIDNVKSLKVEDKPLIVNMEISLKEHIKSKGVDESDSLFGFHWPPFNSVKHLHMHGIAPVSKMSVLTKMVYKPGSPWFSTSEYAQNWLK
ncbi:adenosine 5'-monophosphoramidase HINT3 isoform X2 [Condylostylus longicornis]|uniref:adenosine 5'-monophosphoramidase HINT3 isoform X2 n=1 Tax=Condylostylus longicornis TaxID=2530218 RepID=UPI00244E4251|nr:adenosine 5'-monophosphoramidase HINT3 isoform X2 [Condylostylus longicornis]